MTQKTDLNINPYYDDFDPAKNYHKVLFKPGFPVQARELTSLQSMLQNQIKDFGEHVFKEGSIVIPGAPTLDIEYNAVKLQATQFSIDISLYTSELIGKTLTGETSGVSASVVNVALPNGGTVEDITIYVKYINSSTIDFQTSTFVDGEGLFCTTNITYGNTTINTGTTIATLITTDSISTGSAASVDDGVYFVRGNFVNVSKQTIILDHYTSTPSYRVGLQINEEIIGAKDDPSLYDNAKGFTNYAAPGADRLKFTLVLTKKDVSDKNDTNFIEILRTDEGNILKIQEDSQYNLIREWIASRTFDESGNYALDPFNITVDDCLNNRLGNGGVYFPGEKTEQGNDPTKDLVCYKVSTGEAYVRGYDVATDGTSILDVEKPRTTEKIENSSIPFEMGNHVRLNSLLGQPALRKQVELCSNVQGRFNIDGTTPFQPTTIERFPGIIGRARLYEINTADTVYVNAATQWDAYFYDVNFFTYITINVQVTTDQIKRSAQVKGASSGATGFLYAEPGTTPGTYHLTVSDVKGEYQVGEALLFNGVKSPSVTIRDIDTYSFEDVKSVYQTSAVAGSGFDGFEADCVLKELEIPNIETGSLVLGAGSTSLLTAGGTQFVGIKTGDIISYNAGINTEAYNRVLSVSSDGMSLTLAGNVGVNTTIEGVFMGVGLAATVTAGTVSPTVNMRIRKRGGELINNALYSGLIAPLPDQNISSVDLSSSELVVSAQLTGQTVSGDSISIPIASVTDGSGVAVPDGSVFEPFKSDRYAVFQTPSGAGIPNGVATIRSDQVTGSSTLEITGLPAKSSNVNVTVKKNGIVSKVKNASKSNILDVTYSRNPQSGIGQSTTLHDGLTPQNFGYGLRVQDEDISLNVPDVTNVIAIYESINISQPVLDTAEFSATAVVADNAIIGENIIGENSNAVARVVTNNGSTPSSGNANKLGIVYLNDEVFEIGENVTFEESAITTVIVSTTNGVYNDVTTSFTLDKGQNIEYYDYSRIVRKESVSIPSRRLMVIFDKYTVPANDKGDVFTVLSYPEGDYTSNIPDINGFIRASDTLDFRPRVADWTVNSTAESPFYFTSRDVLSTASENAPKWILSPKEASLLGYEFYLGRIDTLYLDQNGELQLQQGIAAAQPVAPDDLNGSMELGTITLPPYLYNPNDAVISHIDNRRYTMRDIGLLEDRIENLENVTTLSLLEVSTETLKVTDANGRDKFKSGFFVDSFEDTERVDYSQGSKLTVDTEQRLIRPIISRNSLDSFLIPKTPVTDENYDSSTNYELLDDVNVQKTGNVVTLKYEEVGWIEQPLATRVVNVNEFHVLAYEGTIALTPTSDNWVRTIRLADRITETTRTENVTRRVARGRWWWWGWRLASNRLRWWRGTRRGQSRTVTQSRVEVQSRDVVVDTGDETLQRSRNTAFLGRAFRPNTLHYQYIDGESQVDFIPKLLEIANDESLTVFGSNGVFQVGETVFGYNSRGERTMSFRVAQSNHKLGTFNGTTSNNDPATVYNSNPYKPEENVQVRYTSTSKVLNVDTNALAKEAQGLYSGYVKKGFKLVGQSSGAFAYVKDLRLITDSVGDILGSYFIRDPHASPTPNVVLRVGKSEYGLNSDITNAKPVQGSKLGSFGSTNYETRGTFIVRQRQILRTTINTNTTWRRRRRVRNCDPLAQSFMVAGGIEAPDPNPTIADDKHGAYVTAVDVWFSSKDPGNAPVTAQIRTVELGIPTLIEVGPSVTLTPDQINVSRDASVATHIQFPEPIYLAPGESYALVLLSPASNLYECWCARFGETTIETQELPNTQAVKYTTQWAMGSLFVSQNGSTWTARQTDDLKMKLYKARFTSTEGTVYFSNPTLSNSNGYTPTLSPNPIITYPKNGQIGVNDLGSGVGIGTYIHVLTPGTEIRGETNTSVSAKVEGFGAPTFGVPTITDAGVGYEANGSTTVQTQTLTGKGSGMTLKISTTATVGEELGTISGITTVSAGSGYQVGDVVGLVTSTTHNQKGTAATFTVTSIGSTDTMFLTDIQGTDTTGESFANGQKITYWNGATPNVLVTTGTLPTYNGNLVTAAFPNEGNTILVNHFNHNMHTGGNKVTISDIHGSSGSTPLLTDLEISETGSLEVGVDNVLSFEIFEGLAVSGNNKGYVRIEDEIISYTGINAPTGFLTGLQRGVAGTTETYHSTNTSVEKYEINGVSLCRINNTHNVAAEGIQLNSYYINISRAETTTAKDRENDSLGNLTPQLSFTNESFVGGNKVTATENIQFDAIIPNYQIDTPGSLTEVSASARTVSGTSIDGSETSFNDLGYQPIQLNSLNEFPTPRLVCSKINETTHLLDLPRNKSFTTAIKLSTKNKNISPIIRTDVTNTEFRSNLLNNAITDWDGDPRVNETFSDPSSTIYVSQLISLDKPADSLKVMFDGLRRDESSTLRVLYSVTDEEGEDIFRLFPGYNNLNDGRVVNPMFNDGLPDTLIPAGEEYRGYQYTADNIGEFSAYRIKIVMAGTNQALPPYIRNLRTIATL